MYLFTSSLPVLARKRERGKTVNVCLCCHPDLFSWWLGSLCCMWRRHHEQIRRMRSRTSTGPAENMVYCCTGAHAFALAPSTTGGLPSAVHCGRSCSGYPTIPATRGNNIRRHPYAASALDRRKRPMMLADRPCLPHSSQPSSTSQSLDLTLCPARA